ncbi:Hpt domain-containing protein [Hephaestia sp. GCM10023244]|uniref:Hpt domain-containing protein n=1 Tax=unclassified Hephaestia TaxID=2631281 RepID=UPI002076F9A5|nr:Hpt domain-containing protein [Hephaestia sp. MAHUQ-44]MCM8730790.1 Hpt domain-containing protein [Hephaestia sp. MAHUQ-44]
MIEQDSLVDWAVFQEARSELGASFVRILGYFREDGVKSVAAIEDAMRRGDSAALIIPAHTLKGESYQFGAEPLATLSERIEMIARDCVETRDNPSEALELVVKLRPLFERTLDMLEREANPLMQRHESNGFGRRAGGFGHS